MVHRIDILGFDLFAGNAESIGIQGGFAEMALHLPVRADEQADGSLDLKFVGLSYDGTFQGHAYVYDSGYSENIRDGKISFIRFLASHGYTIMGDFSARLGCDLAKFFSTGSHWPNAPIN